LFFAQSHKFAFVFVVEWNSVWMETTMSEPEKTVSPEPTAKPADADTTNADLAAVFHQAAVDVVTGKALPADQAFAEVGEEYGILKP
jgi:hypothetical protein